VVDCDVHQGDGTAQILGPDPERSRSRCTARATTRSSASRPTWTSTCRAARATRLPRALDGALDVASRPRADVAFYLAGADPWEGDRLGRLALTKAGCARATSSCSTACWRRRRRVVVLAGGYAPDVRDTSTSTRDGRSGRRRAGLS
jgi:acetoin utilization deacetylase AcuC-like enzyme